MSPRVLEGKWRTTLNWTTSFLCLSIWSALVAEEVRGGGADHGAEPALPAGWMAGGTGKNADSWILLPSQAYWTTLFRDADYKSVPLKAPPVVAQPGIGTPGLGHSVTLHHRMQRTFVHPHPEACMWFFVFTRLFSCLQSFSTDQFYRWFSSFAKSIHFHSFIQ